MSISTQLEDLSDEIFFEILDYLHAGDIFYAFSSLNSRISLILNSIRLHVRVHLTHCRRQVEFLSTYLKFHSNQVVSLVVYDSIRDQTNVITYLFNRHNFINLHSCTFVSIISSFKLKIVFEQLTKLTKMVFFRVVQSNNVEEDKLSTSDAQKFSQLILTGTLSTLFSAALFFHYDYPSLATQSIVTTNLAQLQLIFYGTSNNISIYSLIPILRTHSALRCLCVTIKTTEQPENTFINVPSLPSIDETDLPISLLLKSFDLQVVMARCDIHSIGLILRCMPNLHRFVFTLIVNGNILPFIMDLINGRNWQEMLSNNVPYLNKFDFHISVITNGEPIDFNEILNSFKCFSKLYYQWQMAINRWKINPYIPFEHINLRTLNYNYLTVRRETHIRTILISDTFDIRSTNISNLGDHYFHSNHHVMQFFMTKKKTKTTPTIDSSNIPSFQNVKHLIVYLTFPKPAILSFLENTLTWLIQTLIPFYKDDDDSQQYFDNLSSLIDLSTVDIVEFASDRSLTRLNVIKHVLLACPNVTNLITSNPLLFSPVIFDNPTLTETFKRLNAINLVSNGLYFPLRYTSKFVQRFPSLTIIKIGVYSIDNSVPIVDIFLVNLARLRFIVVNFKYNSLLDDPCPRDYIIEKRRQSFGLNKSDEYKVVVKIEGHKLYIWLS